MKKLNHRKRTPEETRRLNCQFKELNKQFRFLNEEARRVNDDPHVSWFGKWKGELRALISKH